MKLTFAFRVLKERCCKHRLACFGSFKRVMGLLLNSEHHLAGRNTLMHARRAELQYLPSPSSSSVPKGQLKGLQPHTTELCAASMHASPSTRPPFTSNAGKSCIGEKLNLDRFTSFTRCGLVPTHHGCSTILDALRLLRDFLLRSMSITEPGDDMRAGARGSSRYVRLGPGRFGSLAPTASGRSIPALDIPGEEPSKSLFGRSLLNLAEGLVIWTSHSKR